MTLPHDYSTIPGEALPPAAGNDGTTPSTDPETFQHYQVLRRADGSLWELGRGAMGVTYKAFDNNLRCPVALKVISAQHLHSEMAGQRFVREARVAARLRHRNIASVYHLGVDPQSYFYSMEFIDGETLEDLVERVGPLPLVTTLHIGLQVARALAAASLQGLIHRDIKPANIMVLHKDEEGEDRLFVKVIDFGLARSYDPGDSNSQLTATGFVGTPLYASPEQLEERDLDVRSDIYSLGVTLWILLAGRPPFEGKMTQVITQHLASEPPWWQLGELPESARALFDRMLRKDPFERFQSASELRHAIELCLRTLGDADNLLDDPESAPAAAAAERTPLPAEWGQTAIRTTRRDTLSAVQLPPRSTRSTQTTERTAVRLKVRTASGSRVAEMLHQQKPALLGATAGAAAVCLLLIIAGLVLRHGSSAPTLQAKSVPAPIQAPPAAQTSLPSVATAPAVSPRAAQTAAQPPTAPTPNPATVPAVASTSPPSVANLPAAASPAAAIPAPTTATTAPGEPASLPPAPVETPPPLAINGDPSPDATLATATSPDALSPSDEQWSNLTAASVACALSPLAPDPLPTVGDPATGSADAASDNDDDTQATDAKASATPAKGAAARSSHSAHSKRKAKPAPTPAPNFFQRLFGIKPKPPVKQKK